MITLKQALRKASKDFLRQVSEYNAIPTGPSLRYYETDCGHVYYKTWLGFLIPEKSYKPSMECFNLWPCNAGKGPSPYDVLRGCITEIHLEETVDNMHPCQILYKLQACYHLADVENHGLPAIQAMISDKVHEGQLPEWCDALLGDDDHWDKVNGGGL